MAKEKRTKPCSNCKKSKVKCIYTSGLPCERCIKIDQAANCQFVPKLPSLKLPSLGQNTLSAQTSQPHRHTHHSPQIQTHVAPVTGDKDITLPPLNPISSTFRVNNGSPQISAVPPIPHMSTVPPSVSNVPTGAPGAPRSPSIMTHISNMMVPKQHQDVEAQWKTQIENRINSFDDKLSDLVDIMKANQKMLMDQTYQDRHNYSQVTPIHPIHSTQPIQHQMPQIQQQKPQIQQHQYSYQNHPHEKYPRSPGSSLQSSLESSPESTKRSFSDHGDSSKRLKTEDAVFPGDDFRGNFLTKDEAIELFNFFDANISQQLFGFEISRFSVNSLWETSPVLVCAISTVASIHHPKLSGKSEGLKTYLKDLCGSLLYKGKPQNENEGFNTIVALILCSFWLSDSQMFTGLALQLAKEYGLNNPYTKNKDKLKLWYLLYVLDGQQSLTFNRQPLVNSQEYSLVHSKEILLNGPKTITGSKEMVKHTNQDDKSQSVAYQDRLNADMRLVSQVEYNQALNEAFKGNAWDLLVPSSFGIPSKSNLELDKWMVSWTVLLSPNNNGAVWSSKSTLIYYNFAKMHINSTAVRKLQVKPDSALPKWEEKSEQETNEMIKMGPETSKSSLSESDTDDSDDSDDDDSKDEFISNKGFLSEDEAIVNASIAMNAAQTVLNLVTNDKDILENLRYVPVHIHIMLYYAALLLLNPPSKSNNKAIQIDSHTFTLKLIDNLKIVKTLQNKIYNNLPIDTKFGDRLIKSLDDVVEEKVQYVKQVIAHLPEGKEKNELNRNLDTLDDIANQHPNSHDIELLDDYSSGRNTPPGPEKIAAWPGSNHGHP